MDRVIYLRDILDSRGYPERISEEQFVEVLKSLPKGPDLGIPEYADDRDDVSNLLYLLQPHEREHLGLPPHRDVEFVRHKPNVINRLEDDVPLVLADDAVGPHILMDLPRTIDVVADRAFAKFTPTLRLRVLALVCRNEDHLLSNGSQGQSEQEIGEILTVMIDSANNVFKSAGIELVFYPTSDVKSIHESIMNQDFLFPVEDIAKLRNLTDEQRDKLLEPYNTKSTRNQKVSEYRGKLIFLCGEGTGAQWGKLGQDTWRWCNKCQGLFIPKADDTGTCPAGGKHSMNGSGNYTLMRSSPAWKVQHNWRFCHKCRGLFFAGNNMGVCPAGGQHSMIGSNYALLHNNSKAPGQDNWRWCNKCQGLFFGGNNMGICPAGAHHDMNGSGNYTLFHNEPEQQVLMSPSTNFHSGSDLEYVRLSPTLNMTYAKELGPKLAHEVGHYLHLWHTFSAATDVIKLTKAQQEDSTLSNSDRLKILRDLVIEELDKVEAISNNLDGEALAKKAFDGDSDSGVMDTPADIRGTFFNFLNLVNNGGDGCGPLGTYIFTTSKNTLVNITPDRGNVMSYYHSCGNFAQSFSSDQAQRMRNVLTQGNRRHLVAVQLGDTVSPGELMCGVWNAATHGQVVVWGYNHDDFTKKVDEMSASGMRLLALHAIVRNGDVLYKGIWNPGTHSQVAIWNWKVEDFVTRASELHNQNMRLIFLESFVAAQKQIRVNAIWNPGTHPQQWVQSYQRDDFTKKYDTLSKQGYRLVHLNSFNLPDGQELHDAVWNPGTHEQHYVIGWNAEDFRQRYDEMWSKKYRLICLDASRVNGDLAFNAVWNPGSHPQFVVWNKTVEQFISHYDEMWQQGMRLISMDTNRK